VNVAAQCLVYRSWDDEFGEQGLVDIASDASRTHMRRMVERLIVSEQSAVAAK